MLKINNLRVELHTSVYPNNEGMLTRIAESMLRAAGGKGNVKSVNGYSGLYSDLPMILLYWYLFVA